jgi:RIO kinase 1
LSDQIFNINEETDKYEHYADQFDPLQTDRQERRRRKPRIKHQPKKLHQDLLADMAASIDIEAGEFRTTYQPARYEASWLLESLRPFYDEELITDVLSQVKGGKEASVYRCEAHAGTGHTLLAAKVYRPRRFRNLRNDKMYREGRSTLNAEGRPIKTTDHRIMRALGKKTEFGAQVAHTSWLMYEYTTLQQLYELGAAVPQPLAAGENAILMGFLGNEELAAPTLNEIGLEPDEAEVHFQEVLRNIELMLQYDLIHGDLSAYNILYWADRITLIDFPQVVNARTNPQATFILERDITRICEYFARQGLRSDPKAILSKLWQRYMALDPQEQQADESRQLVEAYRVRPKVLVT